MKIDLKKNVNRIATNFWKDEKNEINETFSERLNTNSDAKFEKSEIFDEMIRFDVKNDENIEIKNVKNNVNDKIFDCDANFKLSNKKIIDSEWIVDSDDVTNKIINEIKKINEFETTNFDFFVWWSRICS